MSQVEYNNQAKNRGYRKVLKAFSISSALSIALLASGCASHDKSNFTVGSVPTDYRTTHPIVVGESEVAEELVVTPSMNGISRRQRGRVISFISGFKKSGDRAITIALPAGTYNEVAARKVGNDIVQLMKNERMSADQIRVTRYHASNQPESATIRLAYEATVAKVHSKCGEWSEDLGYTPENRNYKNYGCATQNNLAEMISNPLDLLGPRGSSEIDAERRGNVITDWRSDGTPDLPGLL